MPNNSDHCFQAASCDLYPHHCTECPMSNSSVKKVTVSQRMEILEPFDPLRLFIVTNHSIVEECNK